MTKNKSIVNPTLIIGGTIAGLAMGTGAAMALKGDTLGVRISGLATCAGGMMLASAILEDDIKNRICTQLDEMLVNSSELVFNACASAVLNTTSDDATDASED